jgi:hypothetical protein
MGTDGDNKPEQERLADVFTAQQVNVTESKSEPQDVTLARLKYENIRFLVVAVGALSIALVTAGFLMNAYYSAPGEAQSRILTVLATLATGAFGAFIGRVSAK